MFLPPPSLVHCLRTSYFRPVDVQLSVGPPSFGPCFPQPLNFCSMQRRFTFSTEGHPYRGLQPTTPPKQCLWRRPERPKHNLRTSRAKRTSRSTHVQGCAFFFVPCVFVGQGCQDMRNVVGGCAPRESLPALLVRTRGVGKTHVSWTFFGRPRFLLFVRQMSFVSGRCQHTNQQCRGREHTQTENVADATVQRCTIMTKVF